MSFSNPGYVSSPGAVRAWANISLETFALPLRPVSPIQPTRVEPVFVGPETGLARRLLAKTRAQPPAPASAPLPTSAQPKTKPKPKTKAKTMGTGTGKKAAARRAASRPADELEDDDDVNSYEDDGFVKLSRKAKQRERARKAKLMEAMARAERDMLAKEEEEEGEASSSGMEALMEAIDAEEGLIDDEEEVWDGMDEDNEADEAAVIEHDKAYFDEKGDPIPEMFAADGADLDDDDEDDLYEEEEDDDDEGSNFSSKASLPSSSSYSEEEEASVLMSSLDLPEEEEEEEDAMDIDAVAPVPVPVPVPAPVPTLRMSNYGTMDEYLAHTDLAALEGSPPSQPKVKIMSSFDILPDDADDADDDADADGRSALETPASVDEVFAVTQQYCLPGVAALTYALPLPERDLHGMQALLSRFALECEIDQQSSKNMRRALDKGLPTTSSSPNTRAYAIDVYSALERLSVLFEEDVCARFLVDAARQYTVGKDAATAAAAADDDDLIDFDM